MSRGRRFARNVVWSLAGQAGTVVVNFLAVPYLLRGFGTEAYGVYLLMYAVANYLILFQFGAGVATIKYVAEANAAGEDGALRDALRYSAWIHFGGVGLGAVLLWLAADPLTSSVFEVPPYYRAHALWLLRAAAVGGFFNAGVQWSSVCFQGLQSFGWPSGLGLFQSILMPLGLVGVLVMKRGLGAAAAWYVVVQAVGCLLGALALRAAVARKRAAAGRLPFKTFAKYGLTFWPAVLGGVVSMQIDKAFVAGLLNMSQLTFYTVPSGVLSRLQTLPATISHALMPMLSETGRTAARPELQRLYIRSTRALFALCLPPLALLFVMMPQLLGLWLSPAFAHSAAVSARLLVAAQVFGLAYHSSYALAGGVGGGRDYSLFAWGQALLSLILWPMLIPRYGIAGAAGGALAAQALPTLYYMHSIHHRLLGLPWKRFLREAAEPLVPPTAALLFVAWAGRSAAWSWPGFLAVNAAAAGAYAVLAWKSLPAEDLSAAARWLKRH